MSKSTFATGDALTKKVWEEKLFRDTVKESYFDRFMGDGPTNLVHVKTQLEKSQGDKITFGIRQRLAAPGVTSGTPLVGNEEKLQTYDYSVSLEQYRHAVRDDGALSRQRAMFQIDDESKMALKDWGSEKIDKLCFDALGIGTGAASDPSKIFYLSGSGGTLSSGSSFSTIKTSLHATGSKLTLNFISAIKAWAKTGGGRAYTPLRPVKVKGKEYYILLVHPDALYDIKADSSYQQANREAQDRGGENPLFTGATFIWDGVVVHEHENCSTAADGGGASVAWTKASFMGQQALVWAWGERPEVVQDEFDYGNEHGYAWGMIAAAGRPLFNSLTYGSVGVALSRTNVSGL